MSDMPDFDSMSPEEMMKWMESLAKRQGAAEGFTTEADLEIEQVDENDERLAGMGEYKPYGMSDDEWAKMQEREAAQKAERLAAQQQSAPAQPAAQAAPPTPEPEPEPAVAEAVPSASDDGAPDFDNMSPEEMMEWMESLAKRQGADEGFTTSASMSVAEVDANDERLAGQGEYKPYGMSDDEWAKMQEREAAQKAAKQAAKQQEVPPQAMAETPPPAPEPEPAVAEAVPASASDDGAPDFDNMSPEEMMEWMESLAKRQGADEGFTTSASMSVAEVDANDERLAGQGEYKPYGMSDDEWAKMQEREAAQKAAKQAAQSEPQAVEEDEYEYVDDDDEYDYYEDDEDYVDYDDDDEVLVAETGDSDDFLAGILDSNNVIEDSDALPSFDDILPAEPIAEAESPMDWLAGLSAGDDDAPDLNFDLGDMGDLGGLGDLTEAEEAGDPMAWLAGLSADEDTAQSPDLSALLAGEADDSEGTMEWMETLAAEEGADSEELMTAAGLDIPRPDALMDDGPGYEEFSFEEATGMLQDNEIGSFIGESSDNEMDLEDPEGWLDSLAAGVGSNEIPDGFFDSGLDNELPDDLFDDEAFEQAEAARADEGQFDNLADNVKAQMESGRLGDSPDDINAFFESAFAKAATRDDVPDYFDDDEDEEYDDDEAMPVQAEIPDWLQESMSSAPSAAEDELDDLEETPAKRATAEMMIQDLGLDEEIEEAEIPDWLQSGMSEDTGIIENDIFAIETEEDDDFELAGMTDTQDTWVDAFSKEESGELASWYETAVANLDGGEVSEPEPQVIQAQASAVSSADVSLEAANLPIESRLDEGSPQNVPDWFGVSKEQSVEVEAVQSDMSWLSDDFGDDGEGEMVFTTPIEDDIDMPDWLQDTVDDSVTADEDLPDWLGGDTDIAVEDIPDWLRETMDEEEEPISDDIFAEGFLDDDEDEVVPAPSAPAVPNVPAVVTQSPAPVPVAAGNIDAVAYLRSAKEKISGNDIDGAMLDYEQVIRANKALGQVEKELVRLSEDDKHKKNPAVNRVLGDVLMRQGKLQEALDTYRKALNML